MNKVLYCGSYFLQFHIFNTFFFYFTHLGSFSHVKIETPFVKKGFFFEILKLLLFWGFFGFLGLLSWELKWVLFEFVVNWFKQWRTQWKVEEEANQLEKVFFLGNWLFFCVLDAFVLGCSSLTGFFIWSFCFWIGLWKFGSLCEILVAQLIGYWLLELSTCCEWKEKFGSLNKDLIYHSKVYVDC